MLSRSLQRYLAFLCILCSVLFFSSCVPQKETAVQISAVISKREAVNNFVNTLTFEQQIGQLFLVCTDGTAIDPVTGKDNVGGETCGTVPAGGYIIFRYNCTDDPVQVISLLGNIRTYYETQNQIQPYFSIDHEGGPVNRLSYFASPLPSPQSVAKYLNTDLASEMYTYAAMQLHALGFQLNFAPVVEAQRDDNKKFLGLRSYGNLEQTVKYSEIAIEAYTTQNVGCVLKHFPGNTSTDPHRGLPVLSATQEQLDSIYAESFRQLVQNNATNPEQGIPTGILMSHAVVTAIDADHPACLSGEVTAYLRTYTGFKGLIFSDDLLMGALADSGYSPSQAVERSLDAGVQVLMVLQPNYHEFVQEIEKKMDLDVIFKNKIKKALNAIICAKIGMGLLTNTKEENGDYSVKPTSIKKLYNLEKQKTDFNSAKSKGSWLYGEYFGK